MGYFSVPTGGAGGGGGGGGGGTPVGEEIFAWNRVDTSQFETTAFPHERDLGTPSPNAATALALDVVDLASIVTNGNGFGLGNALRITATNLAGGGVFAPLLSELTLPDHYVIVSTIAFCDNSSLFPSIHTCFSPGASAPDFQGIFIERILNSASLRAWAIVDGRPEDNEALTGSGFMGPVDFERGGVIEQIEVWRQNGATPAKARVIVEDRCPAQGAVGYEGAVMTEEPGVGTNWDGVDMTRCGLGCWNGTTASGSIAFRDFRIYAPGSLTF